MAKAKSVQSSDEMSRFGIDKRNVSTRLIRLVTQSQMFADAKNCHSYIVFESPNNRRKYRKIAFNNFYEMFFDSLLFL